MTDVEAGLLAAIYAAPDEDAPREVYADWLSQRGDPRGEFIALQLRGIASPELLDVKWLGSLERYVASPTFQRGFPIAGTLRETSTPPPDPAWATFHEVTGGMPDATMPLLRAAYELDPNALARLESLDEPAPPIVELGVWGDWHGAAILERYRPRVLILDARREMIPANITWPWRGSSLESLRLRTSARSLPAWFDAACGSQLRELSLAEGAGSSIVTWDDARLASIEVSANEREFVRQLSPIIDVLERSDPETIVELVLHAARDAWLPGTRNRMLAALERHPAIDVSKIAYLVR